jgi:hypothetical protein
MPIKDEIINQWYSLNPRLDDDIASLKTQLGEKGAYSYYSDEYSDESSDTAPALTSVPASHVRSELPPPYY